MTTLRAFLAVELGDGARRAAAAAAERLAREVRGRDVRWARPESYHLTLRFLGEIPAEPLAPLVAAVAAELADLAPFEVQLGGLELFPSPRRPRVIAARLEPAAPLAELARRVEAAAVRAGFPAEERPFRAHLTLGRLRDRAHPALEPAAADLLAADPFRVAEVVLFRSDLQPDGALHTPLERIALGGNGPRVNHTSEGAEVHGEEHPAP
jgi:2'-5' RNA ligase